MVLTHLPGFKRAMLHLKALGAFFQPQYTSCQSFYQDINAT